MIKHNFPPVTDFHFILKVAQLWLHLTDGEDPKPSWQEFFVPPHAGGSAATAGSGLTWGWVDAPFQGMVSVSA